MNQSVAVEIGQSAMTMMLMIAAPMLIAGLVVGLAVSIFQAATQINEFTLSFVPKILAVIAAAVVFGPWIMNNMLDYTNNLFQQLPYLIR